MGIGGDGFENSFNINYLWGICYFFNRNDNRNSKT